MLTCLNYDQNMKLLETRQKSSLCMYKPNEIIFKVFKIIIIFQFKNFNSKLKKKIYTQTTDLSTPGKKTNKKPNKTRKSAISGTQRSRYSQLFHVQLFQGLFLRFFILQPVSLVKLKVHFIYYLKVLYSVKPELYVKYCL